MPHITLTPYAASYQYNNTQIQQNNGATLLLSNRICRSCRTQSSITFTLMPPPIDFSFCVLDSVMLQLPIQRFYFHNYPLYNRIMISPINTYQGTRAGIEITPSSFRNGFVNVDITALLRNWNPNQTALFKMMVSVENPGLTMHIKNNSAQLPMIHIMYHTIVQNRFTPTSDNTNHSYIEVCSVSKSDCFIQANDVFLFDSIHSASNITYSTENGLFSISSPGFYYVDWMLYVRGTGSVDRVRIGILNQSTGETFSFNSPCVIPGQICGQHILHVENPSYQCSLFNSSEATIQLCSNEPNASLIIYKLY